MKRNRTKRLQCNAYFSLIALLILSCFCKPATCFASGLTDSGIYVIPYPQKVTIGGEPFYFSDDVRIVLEKNHSQGVNLQRMS